MGERAKAIEAEMHEITMSGRCFTDEGRDEYEALDIELRELRTAEAIAEAREYAAHERELAAAADEDEYAWERVESGEAPF